MTDEYIDVTDLCSKILCRTALCLCMDTCIKRIAENADFIYPTELATWSDSGTFFSIIEASKGSLSTNTVDGRISLSYRVANVLILNAM